MLQKCAFRYFGPYWKNRRAKLPRHSGIWAEKNLLTDLIQRALRDRCGQQFFLRRRTSTISGTPSLPQSTTGLIGFSIALAIALKRACKAGRRGNGHGIDHHSSRRGGVVVDCDFFDIWNIARARGYILISDQFKSKDLKKFLRQVLFSPFFGIDPFYGRRSGAH
jgi:hypothetical protein